jgi:hypothetical protein
MWNGKNERDENAADAESVDHVVLQPAAEEEHGRSRDKREHRNQPDVR